MDDYVHREILLAELIQQEGLHFVELPVQSAGLEQALMGAFLN